MKILITDSGEFLPESADTPKIGHSYFLDDAVDGTEAQNRLFHSLLTEYHKSGLHPVVGGSDWQTLKNWVKRKLGAGFESFVWVDQDNKGHPVLLDAKKYADIPKEIRNIPWKRDIIRGRLKSWSDYTNKERRETITKLISDMLSNNVCSQKFDEILKGIDFDW